MVILLCLPVEESRSVFVKLLLRFKRTIHRVDFTGFKVFLKVYFV